MLLLATAKLYKIRFFFHGQEKRCRILERQFWLFQCSRNLECPDDYYPIFVDGLSAANLDHFGGPIYLGNRILKFVFSKKATKLTKSSLLIWHFLSKHQINGEDFVNFCRLHRKHALYVFIKISKGACVFSTYSFRC